MFRCPVQDRSLTLLRAAVLVTAGDPTRLLIPAIFAWNAVAETFLLSILRYLRCYLAIDLGSK